VWPSLCCRSGRRGLILRPRRDSLNTTTNLALTFTFCATFAGCALPIAGLLASQGTTAAVALSLGPLDDLRDRTAADQCRVLAERGVSVIESLEWGASTSEGNAVMFEPGFWRPEFAHEGYPQVERSRTPVEVTLAIAERSLTLIPPPGGAVTVRIPYELVRSIEVRGDAGGTPISLVVGSCQGRFDIVTFRRQGRPDPMMISDAATALRARVPALGGGRN